MRLVKKEKNMFSFFYELSPIFFFRAYSVTILHVIFRFVSIFPFFL